MYNSFGAIKTVLASSGRKQHVEFGVGRDYKAGLNLDQQRMKHYGAVVGRNPAKAETKERPPETSSRAAPEPGVLAVAG